MEKKKLSLSTIILLLAILIILGMVYYIGDLKKENNTLSVNALNMQNSINNLQQENVINKLQIGTYQITEHIETEGPSYDDIGVTFAENNLCSVYEGYGSSFIGTYIVEDNQLTCNTIIRRGEEGGICYAEGNIVFKFDIISNDEIKLLNVLNNSDLTYDSTALKPGMTYKLSDANIKVLIDD